MLELTNTQIYNVNEPSPFYFVGYDTGSTPGWHARSQ